MNNVTLIGRLVKDVEVRYTQDQTAIAQFTIAIDRPVGKDKEKQTDFPRIIVFGKQAENCERYISKGSQVGIEGRIQTGSYTGKEGQKVYTTDVVANRVEFLGQPTGEKSSNAAETKSDIPEGFTEVADEDIPF